MDTVIKMYIPREGEREREYTFNESNTAAKKKDH
jgi:hypothetical protein